MGAGNRDRDRDHNRDEEPAGQPPRSRLEDEVLEILVRADQQPISLRDHVRRRTAGRASPAGGGAASRFGLDRLGPGAFWIGSLAAAFLGMLTRDASPLLAALLGLVSAVLFAALWFRRSGSGPLEAKRWRGRDLDLGPGGPAWLEGLRDRFRRPPRL